MDKFNINNFGERLSAKNEFDGNLIYGAKKFHFETNRAGEGKPSSGYLIREHAKVVEDTGKERYIRKPGYWEEVKKCPVCFSEEKEFFIYRMGLEVYRCKNCSHRYLNPRIKYDEAMKIYADDKTASDIYTVPLEINIDEIKYQYGLELVNQLIDGKKEKIMDIGCGAGVYLKVAFKNGWEQCVGIDVNERYNDIYKETKGVQFISSSFESLDPDKLGENYDCIALWSVLEHLYDLNNILTVVKKLLRKDGLLFILVPNVESLATRLMREMSPTFNWKHISHFSQKSLTELMKRNNFEKIFMETVITEIDNIKSYMSGEYPYHGYGDPENLFSFITPEYIHKNFLGSRMIGIFKNVK
jgi:2-polyprenyl-3-methyl-5-hydroxy-6-metoxy-1,4-benzoquinol methylase